MAINVSKRSESIPDVMKTYAEEQIQSVIDVYPKISSVSVILGMEKNRYTAEAVIHGKHVNVESDHEAFDLKEAIDAVVAKIDKQLRKHIDKVQDHHKPDHTKPEAEASEENEIV